MQGMFYVSLYYSVGWGSWLTTIYVNSSTWIVDQVETSNNMFDSCKSLVNAFDSSSSYPK